VADILLDLLTAGARRALPFISSLALGDFTSNEILRRVADAGLGVRRQEGLDLIRQLRGITSASSYVKAIRNNFLPDISRLPKSIGRLPTNFYYNVRVEGIDPLTGENIISYHTVATDELLTKNQVYDQVVSVETADEEKYPIEIKNLVVESAVQNALGLVGF
jgi:hypothetical protein